MIAHEFAHPLTFQYTTDPMPEPDAPATAGSGDYVVEPGDCIASIAFDHGFFWQTLWDDSGNSSLKEARSSPDMLLPGDLVTVPALRVQDKDAAVENRHRYRRKGVPAKLRLQILEPDTDDAAPPEPPDPNQNAVSYEEPAEKPIKRRPLKNVRWVLNVDGHSTEGTTSDDGMVEATISPSAQSATLQIEPGGPHDRTIEIDLGRLDPIETLSGAAQRLRNLAFDAPDAREATAESLAQPLTLFQKTYDLTVNGEYDGPTKEQTQRSPRQLTPMRQLFFSFDRINFSARPDVIGSNTVHILVEVEGASLTIPDADYTVPDSRTIVFADTPSGGVIGRVDIADDRTAPVLIRIEVIDIDVFSSPSLPASSSRRIHWPYNSKATSRDTCAAFNTSPTPSLSAPHLPRQTPQPGTSSPAAKAPTPCTAPAPRPATTSCTSRPTRSSPAPTSAPRSTGPPSPQARPPAEHHGRGFTSLSGNPRLVKNPSCIPIVREADRAAAGDTSTIRLTYFRPNTLITTNFSWNAVSLADGGQVEIVGSNTGDEISVRGTRAGEAGLEISYNGSLVSVYRVLVAPLKIILCRATILHEGDMSTCPKVLVTGLPTSGAPAAADLDSIAARILEHINGANRMLIQLGILLRLDSDTTVTDGARRHRHPRHLQAPRSPPAPPPTWPPVPPSPPPTTAPTSSTLSMS